MLVSFDGVGQVCATFQGGGLTDGQVVQVSGRGTVSACGAGDAFCGVVSHGNDDACSVQVRGFVTLSYSGTAPSLGKARLCADGKDGVKTAADGAGAEYLTVDVDTALKTVTVLL